MTQDFSEVTEQPGARISAIQLARAVHRYDLAARTVARLDVLEVGCGTGAGLGYLARSARSVVGSDYTDANVEKARRHYGNRISVVRADAGQLPFDSATFDAVVLLEAIYYLPDPLSSLHEFNRVLRRPGRIVIGTVNPAWPEFTPSSFSTQYFNSVSLSRLMREAGYVVQLYGAFPSGRGPISTARSNMRRAAVRLGVVPGTLGARVLLKRLFYGPLVSQPAELVYGAVAIPQSESIDAGVIDRRHSVIYAIGTID